ncbi:MAG: four helix bundle protein [Acidimicrobiia bacterium]|nr:four helix bundle protein [Acidimicrobiia bacterium]NNL68471.1 four helix bundle protein [Acidimicrobiia bacterium]
MGDYQELRVWAAAVEMAVACHSLTKQFPKSERFELSSQLRRASVSVAANLAEGAGRKSDRDFARFIRIARGSANEVETLLILANRFGYVAEERSKELQRELKAVKRQLAGLERQLH